MRYFGNWNPKNQEEKHQDRIKNADYLRLRGTNKIPGNVRSVIVQSGPRGVLLSWDLPEGNNADIVGYRIYRGDEQTLYKEIRDRGRRQEFIEAQAGTTPPTNNFFISCVSSLGREGQKIQIQGKATAETGAPALPTAGTEQTGKNLTSSYAPPYAYYYNGSGSRPSQ